MHVCLYYGKVHAVKIERCASTARARGAFTEAAHDGPARSEILYYQYHTMKDSRPLATTTGRGGVS
eukprot:COSAG02_NODE_1231_length_13766_cov_16.546572_6_plen_66_part_00